MNQRCDYCYVDSPDLKACSGCKTTYYCCVEHQKKFWRFHRYYCRYGNEKLIRQPPFEAEEAFGLMRQNGIWFDEPKEGTFNQKQVNKAKENYVNFYNKTENFDVPEDNSFARNSKICDLRGNIFVELSVTQKTALCHGTKKSSLLPFYSIANPIANIDIMNFNTDSKIKHNMDYYREQFRFASLWDVSAKNTMAQTFDPAVAKYMASSMVRLEKITGEMEEKGMDLKGLYRKNTTSLRQVLDPVLNELKLKENASR